MSAPDQPQEEEVTDSIVEKEETRQVLAVAQLTGMLQARPGQKQFFILQ